jgi:hypothetical protein
VLRSNLGVEKRHNFIEISMDSSFKLHKKVSNFCSFRVICCGYVFDGSQVQTAIVEQTKKGAILRSFGRKEIRTQQPLCGQNYSKDTTYHGIALPSNETLMRPLTLPPLSAKEMAPAINDLLEQTLAVNLDEAHIVHEIIGKDSEQTTLATFISRKSDVEAALDNAEINAIDPQIIIPKAIALARFVEHFHLSSWQFVIDIDDQEISYVLLHDYKVIESRVIPGSAKAFEPSAQTPPELETVLQRILETTNAYIERYGLPKDTPLTITGKASSYELAPNIINEYIKSPLSTLHHIDSGCEILSCAAAIGTAFCCDPTARDQTSINFRNGFLAHKDPFLHWKRPIISFALASAVIAIIILWYGLSTYSAITQQMQKDWEIISTSARVDSHDFSLSHKNCSIETPSAIVSSGYELLHDVEKQALFPLEPNIPRVKDVFSWLSMQIDEVQKKIGDTSEFEIQSLHYALVKYPCKKSPKDHYQVHVSLEFTTPSVALARAFHEHLTCKCPFLQNPSEISWSPGAGKYKIGFYTKDLTSYPPMSL